MANSPSKQSADEKAQSTRKTFTAFSILSIFESLNFSAIFSMHATQALLDFLFNTPLRFILFPSAAIYGLSKAALLWRNFHAVCKDYNEKKDSLNAWENKLALEKRRIAFLQALWETLNSLGTTGAVVTGIVGFFIGAAVGMGISITFNFFLAASTAICAAYSVYYAYTAFQAYKEWGRIESELTFQIISSNRPWETTEELRKNHPVYRDYQDRKQKAIENAVLTVIVGLLTTGVVLAMVIPPAVPFVGATIGIAGCLAAAGYAGYCLYQMYRKKSENQNTEVEVPALKRSSSTDYGLQQKMKSTSPSPPKASLQNSREIDLPPPPPPETLNRIPSPTVGSMLWEKKTPPVLSLHNKITIGGVYRRG